LYKEKELMGNKIEKLTKKERKHGRNKIGVKVCSPRELRGCNVTVGQKYFRNKLSPVVTPG
jgi:hypothetical protein